MLRNAIPAQFRSWARFKCGRFEDFYPYGFAMNGQTSRLEAVREIIYDCQIKQIIETGTFRGTTTEWLAEFGVPVISIEAHDSFYEFSKRRLAKFTNVSVQHANSADALKAILPTLPKTMPTLLYLDAHCEMFLPLGEELRLICSHLEEFVVLIDDFEVLDDPGYAFDNYGPGKALTEGYLRANEAEHLHKFYPSIPSNNETGRRRGWIVLTCSDAISKRLEKISLLRRGHGQKSPAAWRNSLKTGFTLAPPERERKV